MLDLSHHAVQALDAQASPEATPTLTINWTRHDRQTWLDELKSRSVGSRRVTTLLKEHVPARLASALCAEAGIADIARVADLPKRNRDLLLDALDQYLNSLVDAESSPDGARGLRIICMVDEAHQILSTKLPSLSRLIRMSRSKGGAIMLVSQSPDDFSGEDDDFLDQMGLVAAFSTNAKPGSAARVLGKGVNLTTLQTGQAYVRRRGDLAARKIKAW